LARASAAIGGGLMPLPHMCTSLGERLAVGALADEVVGREAIGLDGSDGFSIRRQMSTIT